MDVLTWIVAHLPEGIGMAAIGFFSWIVKGVWGDRKAFGKRVSIVSQRVSDLEQAVALQKKDLNQLQEDFAKMDYAREAFIKAAASLDFNTGVLNEIKVDVKQLTSLTSDTRERVGRLEGLVASMRMPT